MNGSDALALAARDPNTITRVYVGTPLGAPTPEGVQVNLERALYCVRLLVEEGYAPVAFHTMFPLLLDEHSPAQRALGIRLDLALMRGMDKVVLFTPDGTEATLSSGMREDRTRALQLGLPIEYRVFPLLPESWHPSSLRPRVAHAPTPTPPVETSGGISTPRRAAVRGR